MDLANKTSSSDWRGGLKQTPHHRSSWMNREATAMICALGAGPRDPADIIEDIGIDESTRDRLTSLLQARSLIESVGDQLRLHPSLDYDHVGLTRVLPTGYRVIYLEETASTNHIARTLEPVGTDRLSIVIAGMQTGGRGRHNRRWRSPPGGIWMSVVDHSTRQPPSAWIDQLAMSIAVTDVTSILGVESQLKWPNDVVIPEAGKLAGVLVEATSAGGELQQTVCGLGFNVAVAPVDLPRVATSLRVHLGAISPVALVGYLIQSYKTRRESPSATIADWRSRSHTLGRSVRIETPDGTIDGLATNLTMSGALVLETDAGEKTVNPEACRRLRYRSG